jgi:two-component system, NarL family, response regulator LiaR
LHLPESGDLPTCNKFALRKAMALFKLGKAKLDVLLYALALGVLTLTLQWVEYQWVLVNNSFHVYAGIIALLFTGLGIWVATKLISAKQKIIYMEKLVRVPAAPFSRDETEFQKLGLSKRELEVLELMNAGLSNQEIAERLFLSVNTVKTHSSRILEKFDVSKRVLAINKAKELRIIP